MSRRNVNIITAISAILMVIGAVMLYKGIDTIICLGVIWSSMALIKFMLYK